MRVLVCGGRAYRDEASVFYALDRFHQRHPITVLIHGGARGADSLAHAWATSKQVPVEVYPADWKRYGKAAGYRRNTQMLTEGKPRVVIAFPGGRGTADMVKQAAGADVTVWGPFGSLSKVRSRK